MTQLWFILSMIFIFIELMNPGLFFFLALALGALITHFAHWYDCLLISQYVYFFISSAIMFGLLHFVVKIMQKQKTSADYQSNTHLLLGKIIEVSQVISDDIGYGKLNGEIWQIKLKDKNQNDTPLFVGMKALIVGIKGCHLQIKPIKQ